MFVGQTKPRPGALSGEPIRHAIPRGDGQQSSKGGHAGPRRGVRHHQLRRQRRRLPATWSGARGAPRHQVHHPSTHTPSPSGQSLIYRDSLYLSNLHLSK